MFKKVPNVKSSSNLKNSERKKLLQACKTQFDDSDGYNFQTQVIKQANYNGQTSNGIIYTEENDLPIWFKEKHSELLIPTVYTCWENVDLLPIVLTHQIVIDEHIFNGANLMIAGCIPPFGNQLKPAKLCGIASINNPKAVVAVGVVQLDMPSFNSVYGKTGVAVNVCHHLHDGLAAAFKIELELPEKKESPPNLPGDKSVTLEECDESSTKIDTATMSPRAIDIDDFAEQLESLSVEDVDHFITRSLYYTLVADTNLKLPISSSTFVSNHIMRNLPPIDHNTVNMKKTSWKKTAKFLKHFEKEGFINLKGKGDDLIVTGFNKERPELKSFVPYKIDSRNKSASGKNESTKEKSSMMNAVLVYKPLQLAKSLLLATNTPLEPFYTAQEIKKIVTVYITAKKLPNDKKESEIIMDDLLYGMVYPKKLSTAPRVIARAAIQTPILQYNFNELYQIMKADGTPLFKNPKKGSLPRIKIVTEMKIGRKVVTRVSNFEYFQIDPEELASDLRKLCSGSTTIGETMTNPKTSEVQVQGPHGQLIINHFNSLAIPTKWIDFENKLKSSKKKRS